MDSLANSRNSFSLIFSGSSDETILLGCLLGCYARLLGALRYNVTSRFNFIHDGSLAVDLYGMGSESK